MDGWMGGWVDGLMLPMLQMLDFGDVSHNM